MFEKGGHYMSKTTEIKVPLYVDKEWLDGTPGVALAGLTAIHAKQVLSKKRKEIIARLQEEGFEITHEQTNLPENTVYLTTCDAALVASENATPYDYNKAVIERVIAAGGEKLNISPRITIEDFFANPKLPAIFKNMTMPIAVDAFYIETEEHLAVIERLYKDHGNKEPFKSAFASSFFQEHKTPYNYKSLLRVTMAATGDIINATLKYYKGQEDAVPIQGFFEQIFFNKTKSDYQLPKCTSMLCYYSYPDSIDFNQPRYGTEKARVLKDHGFNPDNLLLPTDAIQVATQIFRDCNDMYGIYGGIDFCLNAEDGKWYYLDSQSYLSIEEWAGAKKIKVPSKKGLDTYLKLLELDADARYEATMMKQKQIIDSIKSVIPENIQALFDKKYDLLYKFDSYKIDPAILETFLLETIEANIPNQEDSIINKIQYDFECKVYLYIAQNYTTRLDDFFEALEKDMQIVLVLLKSTHKDKINEAEAENIYSTALLEDVVLYDGKEKFRSFLVKAVLARMYHKLAGKEASLRPKQITESLTSTHKK